MDKRDFASADAWCKYKFERESLKEERELLQLKLKKSQRLLHTAQAVALATICCWLSHICLCH